MTTTGRAQRPTPEGLDMDDRPLADIVQELCYAAGHRRPTEDIFRTLDRPENPATIAGGWIPETTQEDRDR